MITFIICLATLIVAYFTYGTYLERVAAPDPAHLTPCQRLADGVDYIKLPRWRVFLIQLLNIAGTGPIFGAILGACFGPVAFLWITVGGIFFGSMHDFLSGMMIERDDGKSIPEVVGHYMGGGMRHVMRYFSIALLILVGAVFILSPAQILTDLVPAVELTWWVWIILAYYLVATLLPIDKIIGSLYPIFGVALIMMALGLLWYLFFGDGVIPEMTTFHNFQIHSKELPIIPTLFITIACGAISGFHATQSPLMARCVGNEKECKSVFYGAMITESIIALIWAAAAMAFFGGCRELCESLAANDNNAGWAVNTIAHGSMGTIGAVLAILGVVAAPITSGDTAFRSARLIIADVFKISQHSIARRLWICIPLFAIGFGLTQVNFGIVWRYFAWCNQALATIVLWSIYVWLVQSGRCRWIALIPAIVMTYVISTFVFQSGQFLGMENVPLAYSLGGVVTIIVTYLMTQKNWVPKKD